MRPEDRILYIAALRLLPLGFVFVLAIGIGAAFAGVDPLLLAVIAPVPLLLLARWRLRVASERIAAREEHGGDETPEARRPD